MDNPKVLYNVQKSWEDLEKYAERVIESSKFEWARYQSVPRMLFVWLKSPIVAKDGIITNMVSLEVSGKMKMYDAALLLVQKTNAYALLALDYDKQEVNITLEATSGVKRWSLPIRRHGDVNVLENEKASTEDQGLGILWRH